MSAKIVAAAMRKAYFLGQTFWQQADSDFVSQHKKSDVTASVFQTLAEETIATVDALQARIDELRAALAIARLCIDPGAMPSPEYESLCKSALTAIAAALQPKEPT